MRRISIFVHWDQDKLIDPYIIAYIKELRTISQEVIFVSNCALGEAEQQKVKSLVSTLIIRENSGLDFAGWKQAILQRGLKEIAETCDELVLANSSCYAPLFPFQEMFDVMKERSCDFWGITENKATRHVNQDLTVVPIAPHVQSYFLVYRKTVLESDVFEKFWKDYNENNSRDQLILYAEVGLTSLLVEKGFHYSVYLSIDEVDLEPIRKIVPDASDTSIFAWRQLVQKRCPTLKLKVFATVTEKIYTGQLACILSYQTFMKQAKCDDHIHSLIGQHISRCCPDYSRIHSQYERHSRFIFMCWLFLKMPRKTLSTMKNKCINRIKQRIANGMKT